MLESLGSLGIFLGIAFGTLVGLPASPLYAAAGVLWGVQGLSLAMLALLVHLVVGYLLARGIARPMLEKMLEKFKSKWPALSAKDGSKSAVDKIGGANFTLLVRALPGVPLCVKTYGLSMMGIPFLKYFLPSLAVESLWVAAYGAASAALVRGQWIVFATACALVVVLIFLTRKISSARKKNLEEASTAENKIAEEKIEGKNNYAAGKNTR